MDKMSIYNKLPVWCQNLACYCEGSRIKHTRYGKDFWRFLAEYEGRANWSYEQLCDYRDAKLRKMIHHCYDTVPYYTKLFNNGGINPNSIKALEDLKKLPILTKDEVKRNIDSMVSLAVPSNTIKIHPTGGTTGAGLSFCTTNTEEAEQWAVWWRFRRMHGIAIDTWCGNFGGKMTVPLSIQRDPYWRINKPGKQIFYSVYHLNEKTAPLYARSLKQKNIHWIHGYPSSIAAFAAAMNRQSIYTPMRNVSIGAENLYPSQVTQIKRAFGVNPIQHYGLTEGVANISENCDGILSVDEDFSCVEFIPTGEERQFRIIGTSLTNWAMPLIRYDTGDLAMITNPDTHNDHGRIVDSLQGRSNECVVLPNGVKVGAAAISLIINSFPEIDTSQIIQNSETEIVFNTVLGIPRDEFDESRLMSALRLRLGG